MEGTISYVARIREQIKTLTADLKAAEAKLRKTGEACEPKPVYEYKAHIIEDSWDNISLFTECIRLSGTITNMDAYDAHIKLYGSISGRWESINSVTYFRHKGLIRSCGGGYLILKEKCHCTDAEWEDLKLGIIAKHMFR